MAMRPTCWTPFKTVTSGGGDSSTPYRGLAGFFMRFPVSALIRRATSTVASLSGEPRQRFLARAVDRESVEESAHLEQFPYLAQHAAQNKSRGIAFGLVGRNEQRAKSGAGQVDHLFEIDDDR